MAEGEALIRPFPRSPIVPRAAAPLLAALLFVAVHGSPAQAPGRARAEAAPVVPDTSLLRADLVELATLDSTIRYDIRYATARNFMGRPMYARPRALLQRPAAAALLRAHRALRRSGYGLLIFDGYRPWRVTKAFWDETPPAKRTFVANPARGSKHNRGCAIDCSLYDLATGREVRMPTPYDDFTAAAAPNALAGTRIERARRDLLRKTMEREGFSVEPNEWWHFDYKAWKDYPVLDVPFERVPER